MNLINALAVAVLPAVFFTMFLRTSKGTRFELGSFFVLRKIKTEFFMVRNLSDFILLMLRLSFVLVMILLVLNPSDAGIPERKVLFQKTDTKTAELKTGGDKLLSLTLPDIPMDRFDRDIHFLKSFVRTFRSYKEAEIVYSPTNMSLKTKSNNIIVFPSPDQKKYVYSEWADIFYLNGPFSKKERIRGTDISVSMYYKIEAVDKSRLQPALELEDGSLIAVSVEKNGKRALIFGTGLSTKWGDMGASGNFIEIISNFLSGGKLSTPGDETEFPGMSTSSESYSRISFYNLFLAALFLFFLESVIFLFRIKKGAILFLFLIFTVPVKSYAEDFKFIEFNLSGGRGSRQVFSVIRDEIEKRTTIRIDSNYYKKISARSFLRGELPPLPYLWVNLTGRNRAIPEKIIRFLKIFTDRGGIIFFDITGVSDDSSARKSLEQLGLIISGQTGSLGFLPDRHPLYRSFYLLNDEKMEGVTVSFSTQRAALLVSGQNLKKRILRREEAAVRASVNIVMYMLTGNYKSDQLHTRQILKRLKKREFYR